MVNIERVKGMILIHSIQKNAHKGRHLYGAGEGNRTLMASLEGWSFTTKLHPLMAVYVSRLTYPIKMAFSIAFSQLMSARYMLTIP